MEAETRGIIEFLTEQRNYLNRAGYSLSNPMRLECLDKSTRQEFSELSERPLETAYLLDKKIKDLIMSIPACYGLDNLQFYHIGNDFPSFEYSFGYPLSPNSKGYHDDYPVIFRSDAILAIASEDGKPKLEITADKQPLLHLPRGYRVDITAQSPGVIPIPIVEDNESESEEERSARIDETLLNWEVRGTIHLDRNWNASTTWTPEADQLPRFLTFSPIFSDFSSEAEEAKRVEWRKYVEGEVGPLATREVDNYGRLAIRYIQGHLSIPVLIHISS
ncbi:MAG: hypothetical protein V1808_04510 [Candidatus Daviesbacteria bacterium]